MSNKDLPHRVGYYVSLHGSNKDPRLRNTLDSTLDITNEIHDPIMTSMIYLTRVATHKGLDDCLGLDF